MRPSSCQARVGHGVCIDRRAHPPPHPPHTHPSCRVSQSCRATRYGCRRFFVCTCRSAAISERPRRGPAMSGRARALVGQRAAAKPQQLQPQPQPQPRHSVRGAAARAAAAAAATAAGLAGCQRHPRLSHCDIRAYIRLARGMRSGVDGKQERLRPREESIRLDRPPLPRASLAHTDRHTGHTGHAARYTQSAGREDEEPGVDDMAAADIGAAAR